MSLHALNLLQLKDMRCKEGKDDTSSFTAAMSLLALDDVGHGQGRMLLIGLPSNISSSSLGNLEK